MSYIDAHFVEERDILSVVERTDGKRKFTNFEVFRAYLSEFSIFFH